MRHGDDASLMVHPLFYFDVLVGWAELLLVATHAHYLKCPCHLFLIRKHERPSCLDKIRQHDHNLRPARMRRHFSIANILVLTHRLKRFRRYSSKKTTSILRNHERSFQDTAARAGQVDLAIIIVFPILHLPFFPPSKFWNERSVASVCAACIKGHT